MCAASAFPLPDSGCICWFFMPFFTPIMCAESAAPVTAETGPEAAVLRGGLCLLCVRQGQRASTPVKPESTHVPLYEQEQIHDAFSSPSGPQSWPGNPPRRARSYCRPDPACPCRQHTGRGVVFLVGQRFLTGLAFAAPANGVLRDQQQPVRVAVPLGGHDRAPGGVVDGPRPHHVHLPGPEPR